MKEQKEKRRKKEKEKEGKGMEEERIIKFYQYPSVREEMMSYKNFPFIYSG